jgi:hypothetical protein
MAARFVNTNESTIHLLKTKAENDKNSKKHCPKTLLLNFQYFELEKLFVDILNKYANSLDV